jgi:hypothetical protein
VNTVLVAVGRAGGQPEDTLPFGLSVQGADGAGGEPDPGVAALGLGCGEHRGGVVDVGQGVAHEQDLGVEVDVGLVQRERFAFAHPGAEDEFAELGEWVVNLGAVVQEGYGLCR